MVRALTLALAVAVFTGRAELLEEAIERAARRELRHALLVGFGVGGLGHLDLDRDDRRLHPVDDVGEGGGAGRGLGVGGDGESGGQHAVLDGDGRERDRGDGAEQGDAQLAAVVVRGGGEGHVCSIEDLSPGR